MSALSINPLSPLAGSSGRLVVIGAGMGGLVFARVAQKHGLEVMVFERDESPNARTQGGTLDMHVESGQWALDVAGLLEPFKAIARPEGEDLRIVAKDRCILWDELGGEPTMARPEVDRPKLRQLLIDSLLPGTIRWNHRLVSITPTGEGECHRLRFSSGVEITADVLIGADGAGSLVRPLVTDAKPAYTGVSFVEIGIDDVQRRFPDVATLVGRGSLFALADNKGLMAQLNGDGRIRVYAALRVSEGGLGELGVSFENAEHARNGLLKQFDGWAPELRRLIEVCDDDTFIPRPIHAMPVGVRWVSRPGFTLLGDAAHQMSPFAGAGANLAMQDGAALALALVSSRDPALAIANYEREMFARAEASAEESALNLEMCISEHGARRMAERIRSYASDGVAPIRIDAAAEDAPASS